MRVWLACAAIMAACWLGVLWPLVALVLMALLSVKRGRPGLWLMLALFYAYGLLHLQMGLASRLPTALEGKPLLLEGEVLAIPQTSSVTRYGKTRRRQWLRLEVALKENAERWPGRHRVQVSSYAPLPAVRAGDRLSLKARLYFPHGWYNQAASDRQRSFLAQQIDARGAIQSLRIVNRSQGLAGWRQQLSEWLQARLAVSPSGRALVPALVVGDRTGIEVSQQRLFQRTGAAHLLAISGLHVAIVAGWVWWLGRWVLAPALHRCLAISRRLTAQQLAWVPALLAATGYAAMAGFSLPTVRALVMLSVVAVCRLQRRPVALGVSLSFALVIVLVLEPLSCLSASLWLSFGAVSLIALLMVGHPAKRVTVLLPLLMVLVGAVLFGYWAWTAPIANLLLVPLFSVWVIPAALGGTMFGSSGVLEAAATGIELAVWSLEMLASWPLPALAVPQGGLAMAVLAAGIVALLPVLPVPRRLLWLVVVAWACQRPAPLASGELEVTTFEVGQGQAMALRTANHLMLYDVGPSWPTGSAAEQVVLPWLRQQRQPLDLAVISHGDNDHAGGRGSLPPGAAVLSGEPDRVARAMPCVRGQRWRWDGVAFRVLWPDDIGTFSGNRASCVIKVETASGSLLLTGDIDKKVEYQLLGRLGRADWLQVGHHGSNSSTSNALLREVKPRKAVITAGYRNRFHHPDQRVLERLDNAAVTVMRTDRHGMIVFRLGGTDNAASITKWRLRHGRPWHGPARWRFW